VCCASAGPAVPGPGGGAGHHVQLRAAGAAAAADDPRHQRTKWRRQGCCHQGDALGAMRIAFDAILIFFLPSCCLTMRDVGSEAARGEGRCAFCRHRDQQGEASGRS
jgi:hypothetical protein